MNLASFPMYGGEAQRPAWEALWQHLVPRFKACGLEPPEHLTWPEDLTFHWQDPRLFLSQACALPFRTSLFTHTEALGAFDFGLPGCPPGYYNSVLVVREDEARSELAEFRNAVWAMNDPQSQSGRAAMERAASLAKVSLGRAHVTGSHVASIRAVADGQADLAAIDAQSWRIAEREGSTQGTRELARTEPTRGLPLITAKGQDYHRLRTALAREIPRCPPEILAPLDMRGFVPATSAQYGDAAF